MDLSEIQYSQDQNSYISDFQYIQTDMSILAMDISEMDISEMTSS
jgi:hypothetical protein